MAVSVGFSAHVVDLLDWFGWHPIPSGFRQRILPSGLQDLQGNMIYGPGWHFGFNWPAFIIVMLLTVVLVRGIKESAETNNIMVFLKIVAIMVFVGFAARFIHPANWHPYAPNGWPGILDGRVDRISSRTLVLIRFRRRRRNARIRNAICREGLSRRW